MLCGTERERKVRRGPPWWEGGFDPWALLRAASRIALTTAEEWLYFINDRLNKFDNPKLYTPPSGTELSLGFVASGPPARWTISGALGVATGTSLCWDPAVFQRRQDRREYERRNHSNSCDDDALGSQTIPSAAASLWRTQAECLMQGAVIKSPMACGTHSL